MQNAPTAQPLGAFCFPGSVDVGTGAAKRLSFPLVSRQYLARPGNGVTDANPCRLRTGPQFQVLGPVVVFDPIAMMNVLSGQEIPAEHLLHDKNVFKDVPCLIRPGVSWRQNHHVPPLVPRAAASPVAIGGSTVVAAGVTGGRMHLLPCPAGAEVVGPA